MKYFDYKENKPHGSSDFPIEFYHIDPSHPQYEMPFHWHVEYEIIQILEGEFHIFLDEKEYSAETGDVIFIRDGIIHGGIPNQCIYECIVFDINMLMKPKDICKEFIHKITKQQVLVTSLFSENSKIHPIVCSIFQAMREKRMGFELCTVGYLYQFIGLIFEHSLFEPVSQQTSRSHKKMLPFKQVLEYIETSYSNPITLDDMSKISGMSPKYFCQYFKELVHRTPIDYLNYYRIERACLLLSTASLGITEIAFQCGFNDISYFIKTFKRYKGITPKKYIQ